MPLKGCCACHEVLCQLLPASPIAAVVSTDIDENGRICGVGTRRLLLCATRMHRVHHVQCGAAGVNGLHENGRVCVGGLGPDAA